MADTRRYPVRVGALIRRAFRRELLAAGIPFSEDRGLLDSLFMVTCSEDQAAEIAHWIDRVNTA